MKNAPRLGRVVACQIENKDAFLYGRGRIWGTCPPPGNQKLLKLWFIFFRTQNCCFRGGGAGGSIKFDSFEPPPGVDSIEVLGIFLFDAIFLVFGGGGSPKDRLNSTLSPLPRGRFYRGFGAIFF